MSLPIPTIIAIVDAALDGLAQVDSNLIPGFIDKARGFVHFTEHADNAFISTADRLKAEELHDYLVSDILEMFAKRGIPVKSS
jgi:hypothetical protein